MKFRVDRDVLAEAVSWTARSLPARPPVPVLAGVRIEAADGQLTLATWRTMIDASRSNDGEQALLGTARRPVARVGVRTARDLGLSDRVVVSSAHGQLELPCEVVPEMVNGVVWVPTNAPGLSVTEHLRVTAGGTVTVAPADTADEEGDDK